MRATIIPPIPLTEKYSPLNGGYHLILASLAKASLSYCAFYRSLVDKGEFVILDNDAYEEGVGASFETLRSLNEAIHPSEIILPDVLTSGSETYRKSELTRVAFRSEHHMSSYPKFMGVPHGSTIAEWSECARGLLNIGVDSLGMARMYGEEPPGLVPYLEELNDMVMRHYWERPPIPVHLLGWSDRLDALSEVANMPYMEGIYLRGVDSSKPLTYAFYNAQIGSYYLGRPEGYFTMDNTSFEEVLVKYNFQVFRRYACGLQ